MRWSPLGHRALIPNRPITWRNLIPLIFRRGDQYKSMRWPVTPCSKRIKSCTFCLYITIKISARWKPFPRSFRISACFTRECARKQERPGHTADIDSPATVPQNIDFCCSRSQSWKPSGRLSGELPQISGVHHGERARETSGDCWGGRCESHFRDQSPGQTCQVLIFFACSNAMPYYPKLRSILLLYFRPLPRQPDSERYL